MPIVKYSEGDSISTPALRVAGALHVNVDEVTTLLVGLNRHPQTSMRT
ncbi:hypothetical protein VIOR3934_05579 [Vibrio orientalis CIP 102891 = ATCC 33934]|uniref:Uncharacterized protein n=1 Tax=Vibrio orientalis CIP 102891 = ATCC 33934 TaxID=675816 RepID=F9SP06_VIBOR|nr:hypothetical protein VIOR3934_05579 [Vibrio orientalis CIP 102891 = ATCC 33934]